MSDKLKYDPTLVTKRSGDTATETPGHVKTGKTLLQRMGLAGPEDKKEPPKEEKEPKAETPPEKPVEAKEKPVEEKPATPPAEPGERPRRPDGKFKKTKPQAAPAVTAKQIGEIASVIVDKALKKDAPAAVDPLAHLTPSQRKRVNVLNRMGELNEANKGKSDEYLKSLKKISDYQTQWQSDPENKGKTFNLDDDEHNEFVSANDVQIDPDDYAEALADIRFEQRSKPITEKLDAQERERQEAKRFQEVQPEVVKHVRATALTFTNQVGGEFKKLLNEGGIVVPDVRDKLASSGEAARSVLGMASQVEQVANELRLWSLGIRKPSRDNALHGHIMQFIVEQEHGMKQLPPEQQENERGQQFATSAEWEGMNADERANHWHLTDVDLSSLYATEMADTAKSVLAKDEADKKLWAERNGYKPAAPVEQPAPAAQIRQERVPPGVNPPNLAHSNGAPQTQKKSLHERMFPR